MDSGFRLRRDVFQPNNRSQQAALIEPIFRLAKRQRSESAYGDLQDFENSDRFF